MALSIGKAELKKDLTELFKSCDGNTVPAEIALEGCAGLVLFNEPLIGVSASNDEIYTGYKRKEVIGETFMLPSEWLPEARSVLSFFFPFTETVRKSNIGDPENTSPEWLHARVEGQALITDYTEKLKRYFEGYGIKSCVPATDKRFAVQAVKLPDGDPKGVHITSNWSERHAAYASGLGTFCLTRGLISSKGVAGRYASIIISEYIEPDERPYTGIYDYCIRCGACIKRCPVNAISLDGGKNQILCKAWNDQTHERYDPRYGCGKCQVGVPCEDRIPAGGKMKSDRNERSFRVISNQVRFGCGYRSYNESRQYFAWHGYPNRNDDFFTTSEISEEEYYEIEKEYPKEISADRETAEEFRNKYVDGHPVILEGWNKLL